MLIIRDDHIRGCKEDIDGAFDVSTWEMIFFRLELYICKLFLSHEWRYIETEFIINTETLCKFNL